MRSSGWQLRSVAATLSGGAVLLALLLYKYNVTVDDAAAWSPSYAGDGGSRGHPVQHARAPHGTAAPKAAGMPTAPHSPRRSVQAGAAPLPTKRSSTPALSIPGSDALPTPAVFRDAAVPLPPWSTAGGLPSGGPIPVPGGGGGGSSGASGTPGAGSGAGSGHAFWPGLFLPVPFFPPPGGEDGGSPGAPGTGPGAGAGQVFWPVELFLVPGSDVTDGGVFPGHGDSSAPLPGGGVGAVPEPTVWAMLTIGLVALLAALRRRKPSV